MPESGGNVEVWTLELAKGVNCGGGLLLLEKREEFVHAASVKVANTMKAILPIANVLNVVCIASF